MFQTAGSRSILRKDLDTHDSQSAALCGSTSPNPEQAAQFQARLDSLYSESFSAYRSHEVQDGSKEAEVYASHPQDDETNPKDPAYSFRLFSSAKPSSINTNGATETTSHAQKITISSPSPPPDGSSGGCMVSARDVGHYLMEASSSWSTRRSEFSASGVAVSGSWILTQSKQRNRGLEVPWRSHTIRLSRAQFKSLKKASENNTETIYAPDETKRRISKPGKKRRIVLRERQRKKEASKAALVRAKEEKEREEREKKTRRNREKKVKKKAREKAKKSEVQSISEV